MIDWFTVVAQIVNFLILVALLKYFLYGRIMDAMDKRQRQIAENWREAEQQREQAANELETSLETNRQLDRQREQMLAKVHDEVEQHRLRLTAKVRREVDELHSRWAEAIQEETDSFLRDLSQRASREVCAIARRALTDLANANLETQIVDHFLARIQNLQDAERNAVVEALREDNHVAVVLTTYELAGEQRDAITESLRDCLKDDLDVRFEESNDLLCGIALQTEAHTLAWNLRDYLTSLETELQQTLEEESAVKRPTHEALASAGS